MKLISKKCRMKFKKLIKMSFNKKLTINPLPNKIRTCSNKKMNITTPATSTLLANI